MPQHRAPPDGISVVNAKRWHAWRDFQSLMRVSVRFSLGSLTLQVNREIYKLRTVVLVESFAQGAAQGCDCCFYFRNKIASPRFNIETTYHEKLGK